ncbi:ANTAR domain-containing response regulator [Alteromonas oceanisediminis]|uniref:ANTAR domain-containing response regulator n=1 Tax=Alteromonas oceanisediminis TaxID=2836180 RepID=UPI001BDA31AB|nr:ANTAR domain-containing protein [Alteromonas oceanisediminis]MBT0586027.1 ANTAR domain-containing protein [Alteromonas oceanisediminis]
MNSPSRLSILLIDDNHARAQAFTAALVESRYHVTHLSSATQRLLKDVDRIQPDIIVIDIESPSRDVLDSLHTISSVAPKPVVMFSDEEDTDIINQSVRSGVTAYVVGDTEPKRVRSILDAAVARFGEYQRLRQELDETKHALAAKQTIDKAKRLLMQQRGMDEQQAYSAMRKMAMDVGQKIEDIARTLLSVLNHLDNGK